MSRHTWQPAQRPSPRPRRPATNSGSWGAPQPDEFDDHDTDETQPATRPRPRPQPAAPPLEAQRAPQPLLAAEGVRVLVVLAVGAVWATPLPDPVLDLIAGAVASLLGLAVSFGATLIAKGKVWALRRGVDTDLILAEAMATQRGRQRR